MPDNKDKQGYQDDSKIDPNDPNERRYATESWGITNDQLMDAITSTDSRSRKVIYEYLVKTGAITPNEK